MSICIRKVLVLLGLLGTTDALAQNLLGKHGHWEAFSDIEGGETICYMGSEPIEMLGRYKTRGDSYAMVTHRPADKSRNVVSIRAGYLHKIGSEVGISIGKSKFKLFSKSGWAFTPNSDSDNSLVNAMVNGKTMVIRGISNRGTKTTDTYSLKGFTAAYRAISKACKV